MRKLMRIGFGASRSRRVLLIENHSFSVPRLSEAVPNSEPPPSEAFQKWSLEARLLSYLINFQ
jgi:hypothetical protein